MNKVYGDTPKIEKVQREINNGLQKGGIMTPQTPEVANKRFFTEDLPPQIIDTFTGKEARIDTGENAAQIQQNIDDEALLQHYKERDQFYKEQDGAKKIQSIARMRNIKNKYNLFKKFKKAREYHSASKIQSVIRMHKEQKKLDGRKETLPLLNEVRKKLMQIQTDKNLPEFEKSIIQNKITHPKTTDDIITYPKKYIKSKTTDDIKVKKSKFNKKDLSTPIKYTDNLMLQKKVITPPSSSYSDSSSTFSTRSPIRSGQGASFLKEFEKEIMKKQNYEQNIID
jgi:hypothetical protein